MLGEIVFLCILILINAFFAASEMAFVSVNDSKIQKEANEGNKKAKQILKMQEAPSKFLATIQIGITLAGFLSSAFASNTFAKVISPVLNEYIPQISITTWQTVSIVLITVILSFFTLIFGELVPKRLAMKHSKKIAYMTIGIIIKISVITSPFVKLLTITTNAVSKIFGVEEREEEVITEDEIKMMIDQGGSIKEDEKEMINKVFELNDITVAEIMKHRTEIFALDLKETLDSVLFKIEENRYTHSRIPVYDETIDEIIGIIYVKDILKNIKNVEFELQDIVKEAYFVAESRCINEVFKELQKSKKQIAIVLDEYGGTAGLITMEDILEELVGDIFDEFDKVETQYEKIDENTYIILGNMTIYDANKVLGVKIPEGEYDTISGYILEILRKNPKG